MTNKAQANAGQMVSELLVAQRPMLLQTGLRRSDYYNRLNRGEDVPRPVRLGPRTVRYVQSEINAWVNARIAERDAT